MTPDQARKQLKSHNFLMDEKSDTDNTNGEEQTFKMHFNITEKKDENHKEKWWQ